MHLLCLFLCQSELFRIHEYSSFHGIKTDYGTFGITAGFSVYRWYHGSKVRQKIQKRIFVTDGMQKRVLSAL